MEINEDAPWTRAIETRTNAHCDQEDFVTYRNATLSGYYIEKWDATTWAIFLTWGCTSIETYLTHRTSLKLAKAFVVEDSARNY